MGSRDIRDFFELRRGLQGLTAYLEESETVHQTVRQFRDAALAFMDKNGIAMGRGTKRAHSNGKHVASLREKVKRHYTQRRPHVVHTSPPLDITKSPASKLKGVAKIQQQREASAALLAQLDLVEPRRPEGRMAALVRRGYAKKKGDGYVRTAKPFMVAEPTKPRRAAAANGNPDEHTDAYTVAEVAKRLAISDTRVRQLVKAKRLRARWEPRTRRGMNKAVKSMVIARDELARFIDDNTVPAAP
jgi:excisionase family DNA binding protein